MLQVWTECPFQGSHPVAPLPNTIRGETGPGRARYLPACTDYSRPFPPHLTSFPSSSRGHMKTDPGFWPLALHEKNHPSVWDNQPLQIHPLFHQQQQTVRSLLPGQWKGDVDCDLQEPSGICITWAGWKHRLPGPTLSAPEQAPGGIRWGGDWC